MDRNAFRNCGAVLVSLGAVLSAGCGAKSVSPSTSAPTASLRAATKLEQQAVVVSRAESSNSTEVPLEPRAADNELVEDVAGTPIGVVAIEPEPTESSIAAGMAVEEIDAQYAQDESTSHGLTEATPMEPEPVATPMESAGPTASEIKFALPGSAVVDQPAADEALEGDRFEGRIAQQARRANPVKRALTPLMITPREIPKTEQALDQDPPAVESPLIAGQPVTVAPVPAFVGGPAAIGSPLVAAEPAAAPLPPVRVTRSPAFTAAMARAHERVRHGIQLAEKGALYASRKEFTTAVKMVAQAQDVEQVTRRHTQAAIGGFVALKEANDFVRQNAELGNLDVARLVSGHKTPVLKDEDVTDMPPTVAAGYYFNYAKDQLAAAVGGETIGSIALYGLGKLVVAGAGNNLQQLEYTGPAMVLFQSALICEPENFRAAHELGVLLAGSGQLAMAREMLMGSVGRAPQAIVWQNLAAVHARLGEQQLANQAQQNANALQQANPKSKAPPVEWVDPATFARTVSSTDPMTPPLPASATQATPAKSAQAPTKRKANVAKKSLDQWNPLNLRR